MLKSLLTVDSIKQLFAGIKKQTETLGFQGLYSFISNLAKRKEKKKNYLYSAVRADGKTQCNCDHSSTQLAHWLPYNDSSL